MRRWWADPPQARTVLSAVDASDTPQAAASAFLGMHALLAESLQPLVGSTLVDGAVVQKHLEDADLQPVTDAVSQVAGNDQAEQLVQQWRQDAIRGAQQVLRVWRGAGMSWPTALKRLSMVVGLPAHAMAGPARDLKLPGVTELDSADAGDRFLMGYAQTVASRAPAPVAKSMMPFEQAEFNRKHPRDSKGRFADKPDRPDERRERRDRRRKRRDLRRRRIARTTPSSPERVSAPEVEQVVETPAAISGLLGLMRRSKDAAEQTAAAPDRSMKRPGLDRSTKRPGMDRSRARRLRPVAAATETEPLLRPGTDTEAMKVQDQMGYVMLTGNQARSLMLAAEKDEFTIAGLADFINQADPLKPSSSRPIFAMNPQIVQEELSALPPDIVEDVVLLELNTLAITDASFDGFKMADTGRYRIDYSFAEIDPSSPRMGMQYESGFYTRSRRNPARSGGTRRPVPIISARLENENEFSSIGQDALPFDRFGGEEDLYKSVTRLHKNLTGSELAEFNRNHPRDEEGQFTRKGAPGMPRDDRRERRIRRRKRRAARAQRYVANQNRTDSRETPTQTQTTNQSTAETTTRPGLQRSGLDRTMKRSSLDRTMKRSSRDRSLSRSTARTMYPKAAKAPVTIDFASASALPLSSAEMVDLTGLDFEGNPVDSDMRSVYDVDSSSLIDIVDSNITTGTDAIDGLAKQTARMMRQATMSAPAQAELQAYVSSEAAMNAAMDYISGLESTEVVWNAVVEEERFNGEPIYYPRMVGYYQDEGRDIIFGSPRALKSLADGFDSERLTPIPAEKLSDLLALRANDEALPELDSSTYRPDPVVRAYWYADGDD